MDGTQVRKSTIRLEIRCGEVSRTFEWPAEGVEAIVVGALLRAHVHLPERGIAPVHLHFERAGEQVILVPAFGQDIYVDSVLTRNPRVLGPRARIEFLGKTMDVTVHRAPDRPGPSVVVEEAIAVGHFEGSGRATSFFRDESTGERDSLRALTTRDAASTDSGQAWSSDVASSNMQPARSLIARLVDRFRAPAPHRRWARMPGLGEESGGS